MNVELLKWFVSGNVGVSLSLALIVGLVLWLNRGRLPRPWNDDSRPWRIIGVVALGLQVAFFLWVSFFDYWRQLMGLLLTNTTRAYSDPYIIAPVLADHGVSAPARAISLILLVAAAIGLALLFYRRVGGIFLPFALFVIGGLLYATLGDARWRMDLWAVNGFPAVGQGTTRDLLIDLAFFLPLVGFVAVLALAQYLTFAAFIALPVVLIGGFLEARWSRPTAEYRQFADALSRHAADARHTSHTRARQARNQTVETDSAGTRELATRPRR